MRQVLTLTIDDLFRKEMARHASALAMILTAACNQSPAPIHPPPVEVRYQLVMHEGPDGQERIFVVDEDGANRREITTGHTPSWTPDGRIIFVRGHGPSSIWLTTAGGGQSQIGPTQPQNIHRPNMARDRTVVWDQMQAHAHLSDTWIMRPPYRDARRLLENAGAPSIALSGTWLAYMRDDGVHREIMRANIDGTNPRMLTFSTNLEYPDSNAPAISPDEKWAAFFHGLEDRGLGAEWGYRNIAILPAEGGSDPIILTTCVPRINPPDPPGSCRAADNPFWSPDSLRVGYDRGSENAADRGTWIMNLDGTGTRRLWPETRGAGAVPMRVKP